MADGEDRRPDPDPARLTTEQLHRELGQLERFIITRLKGTERVIAEKFTGVERRLTVIGQLAEEAARAQDRMDERLDAVKDRLGAIESTASAAGHERAERRLDYGQVIAAMAVVVAVVAVIMAYLK